MTEAKIPMLDLAAQHAEIEEELLEGLSAVVASGRFVLGETVRDFEAELAGLCGARFAVGCNSGTDALWLALTALDIGPGDEVLCPGYSFIATAAAILRTGATPLFCDVDPLTLNLCPEDARRRAASASCLRALISVDLFGRACETGALTALASELGIPIIQDAAQSIGALDGDGIGVGQRSQIACFSFYPTKNLGALGDAGALVTSDPALDERLRRLRSHGVSKEGQYEELGINSRLDALQAVALSTKLPHLERWTSARRQHALRYDRLFTERGAATSEPDTDPRLENHRLPLATPLPSTSPALHTYHRYVIRVPADRRSALRAGLAEVGIASEIYYPIGLHQQPAIQRALPSKTATPTLPAIERACKETLALPLYPEMGVERVERVVDAVTKLLT